MRKSTIGEDRDGKTKQVGHKFDVCFKMKVVRDKLKYLDKQNHELTVKFAFPCVGDRLKYNNPDRKSDGYKIHGGRKSKKVTVNL